MKNYSLSRLKTIIVDDTQLVRNELKSLLNDYAQIDVIGEAADVNEAIQLINMQNPDVIFLDIQLQGETGFDLLEKADISSQIIFITAYDQYAIRAFEVNALDYLLKPINKERLSKAISRLLPNESNFYGPQHKVKYNDVIYVNINGSKENIHTLFTGTARKTWFQKRYRNGRKSFLKNILFVSIALLS